MASDLPIKKLIVGPAVITLAITLIRLMGELLDWSPQFFSKQPGGGASLVGISWLPPLFGIYFAWKLTAMGHRPAGVWSAIGYPLLGFAVMPVIGFGAVSALGLSQQSTGAFALFVVLAVVGAVITFRGWPALARTLLGYALAARIPVVIVMLFAILGNWGTHYDVAPSPDFPAMAPLMKWFMIGVLPQLTIWIWWTIALGALFGGITAAILGKTRGPATA